MYRVSIMETLSVKDIILLWPTAEELGRDIGEPGGTVRAWGNRNRIPSKHWCAIVASAEKRGLPVSYETLAVSHASTLEDAA